MNIYNPKHVLKFLLPLFVFLTSCGFPGTDDSSTKVITETPTAIANSPTPTASLVAQMPTETLAPTFTPTSTPTTTPTPTATLTSTATPTPLPTLTNTPNPPSVTQPDQNSSINPPAPGSGSSAPETVPNTGPDAGSNAAPAAETPLVIDGFVVPVEPWEEGYKTPTPCLVCIAD